MLHTFLGSCWYTEQWRRPLRLQAHSSSVDQGHSIAMERQTCPSISSAMVCCKGIERCPYFTDWNDTFTFFFTPSPQSSFFFFLSYRCTISSHQGSISIDIYVSTYIYTERERETDQKNKHFLIHCIVVYKHNFFTQECHQRPFFPTLYCVSVLLWDSFFSCFGVGIILLLI